MKPYGVVAEFESADAIHSAAQRMKKAGYERMEGYTPYAVEGLAEELGFRRTAVPAIMLLSGIAGGTGGYFMMWYSAVISYPLNVGGRPLHSWVAFIPITFEMTILFAAVGGVLGMIALNGLPRPHHPIFNTPHFRERNSSRFYLCVEAADIRYDAAEIEAAFRATGATEVWEVEA